MFKALTSALALILLCAAAASAQAPADQPRWFKGNTHTHTLNSDGDSTPDEVVRWYREHGYQFLVLTDHNFLTSVDGLNALHGADQKFLVVQGEEVTDRFGEKPLHVNGLGLDRVVAPQGGASVVDVLQRNVNAIRQENGVPHINHPNFRWAVTQDELREVRGNRLFEIFNGHPQVNNVGGGGVPGLEEAWDAILSAGTLLYGIAVDDAHAFKQPGNPAVAGPGRGWVMVRAPRLDARLLLEAMERGDFYASTGVVLEDVRSDAKSMSVIVKADAWAKYRIQFIGKGGRILREVAEPAADYAIAGDEGYVRARVLESNGRMAWVQPVVVRAAGPAPALWLLLLPATLAAGVCLRYVPAHNASAFHDTPVQTPRRTRHASRGTAGSGSTRSGDVPRGTLTAISGEGGRRL
jgi:hypothetical protein